MKTSSAVESRGDVMEGARRVRGKTRSGKVFDDCGVNLRGWSCWDVHDLYTIERIERRGLKI